MQAVNGPENRMRGGPVSRILSKGLPPLDDHSSGRVVTRAPQAANPDVWGKSQTPGLPPRHPYLALLPVGLAVPLRLPVARWALTPPFHPYPSIRERAHGRFHFCGAFRRIAPPGRYPAPWPCGVRTFLERLPARGHPALRASLSYAWAAPGSSPDALLALAAISAMIAQSRPSSGPSVPWLKRSRIALSSSASSRSGKP